MKTPNPILKPVFAALLALAPAAGPQAEDIDLFVSAATTATANNPNVLFIIDNSASWNANNQHWVGPNGESPFKQGQSELRALKRIVEEATDKVNIGLMMFQSDDEAGTYVRYAVRTMTDANKTALSELIGDAGCATGTGANGTPKCIFKNFSGSEQVSSGDPDYSAAMFEAFKYFGGCTSPIDAQTGTCKTDTGPDKFGMERYAGPGTLSSSAKAFYDQAAYTDSTMSTYVPPAGTANSCANNYIIFIGNGFPNPDMDSKVLAGVEGQINQLSMPNFTTTEETTSTVVGTSCGASGNINNARTACTTGISQTLKDSFPADTYACVGPELADPGDIACPGNNNRLFDVEATKTVFTVTATGTSSTPTNKAKMADEWARYLFTTDVSETAGIQNVTTYTLDVFKDQQDQDQTALLFSMAKYGGGRYFQASSEQAILAALRDIMVEIQAVNTVFASASLPINATSRSQNENQVYIGMFRPDPGARPRWYGNLKRYQVARFGTEIGLGDASNPPREAVSSQTGFIHPCAVSFWTTDTSSSDTSTAPPTDTSYWNFSSPTGSHVGTCTSSPTSLFSDLPDGPQVEKGSTAQVVRLGNNPLSAPDFLENRNIFTCSNDGTNVSCNTATAMHAFNTTNVTQAAVGAADGTEHARIIDFTRGVDAFDDNSRLANTDVRPSVHGDVVHSRPSPVNYGGSTGVVIYYGANDGTFRAVAGQTGKELWAFIAPEHHRKLKRLVNNDPLISYPPFPASGSAPKDYFFDGSAGLFQNVDDSKVWIFPSMRRGGRMVYAFDITAPADPRFKWRVGCTDPALTDTSSCTPGFEQMGQSWSTPSVALVKGFSSDPESPVIIMGGGYDTCDDQDALPNTACTTSGYTRRGNTVYVINAATGALLKTFTTNGSVPADPTIVDRDFDGFADHVYVADTTGHIYRIDFVEPGNPSVSRAPADWTMTEVAHTSGDNRKFLFSPAALPSTGRVYLSLASGDRERPLIINYPYPTKTSPGVLNRAYMVVDKFAGGPIDLDDTSVMEDFSAGSTCTTATPESVGKSGWFINLNAGAADVDASSGEQGVTSSIIFGGLVFFSTNRPIPTPPDACSNDLGEARGYVLNLLNASGAADTANICGGARSTVFIGGGLPPSPVTGTVPVDGPNGTENETIMIGGGREPDGASEGPLNPEETIVGITQRRSRLFWYTDGDK